MPLPKPSNDETKDEWLDRCMDDPKMIAEFEGEDQRFGVCNSLWDTKPGQASLRFDVPEFREVDTRPTEEMARQARRGLEERDEYGRGGTDVGVARARDIANRENLSEETINRMVSFFARHEDNYRPDEEESDGGPTAGTIAYRLWGGPPGKTWAERKQEEFMNENDRNLPPDMERRSLTAEVRVADGEERQIGGYAAVYNSDTQIMGMTERIAPGAFDESLSRGDDVVALFNHDSSRVLGRTTSGTLRLSSDDTGLRFDVDVPDTTTGNELHTLVSRGDVTGASFGFMVEEEDFREDDEGNIERTINRARLFDVSPATYPAYGATKISARSLDKLEELRESREEPEEKSWFVGIAEKRLKLKQKSGI
jgi:hypothetical protein